MKLFVLLSRVPYPLVKGDKLRAYHHIRCLSKYHEIHLFCLNDTKLHPDARGKLSEYCRSITIVNLSKWKLYAGLLWALLSNKPFQVGYFYNKKVKKQIADKINEIKPGHIFCQLIRVAEYIKDISIPKTLDYQDVFSKGAERMSSSASFFIKPVLRMEARRVKKYERTIFDKFNNKIIISHPDRDIISHPDKNNIEVVMNGVDTEFFKPLIRDKEYDLLFTGNMAYMPNINSVEYLVNEILPVLKKKKPGIKILIAGATPDKKVLNLACDNVTVSGWVEDIRECYAKSKIFVAPMQIGTGMQNKLLEAMAMKLPCVTSGLANNALLAADGQDILVGYSTEDYAMKILRLLDEPELYQKLSESGHSFVTEHFNWKVQTDKINTLIINTR
ncbi:MAG: glycosyltransferase [Bacteroidales bacterium]|nr:glycosyltransferase [Bacteroidales bacterium]